MEDMVEKRSIDILPARLMGSQCRFCDGSLSQHVHEIMKDVGEKRALRYTRPRPAVEGGPL